jgi:hypothetical protein
VRSAERPPGGKWRQAQHPMSPGVHFGPAFMTGQAYRDTLPRIAPPPDGQRKIPLEDAVILKDGC